MLDDRRVAASKRLTSYMYSRTCKIIGYSTHDIKTMYYNEEITKSEYLEKKAHLDSIYVEQICKLSTSVLNEILQIHETKQLRRAARTLDAIANELLERELHGNQEAVKKAK